MKTYIQEIKENDQVDSPFLVKEKFVGLTKSGNPYLKLLLTDRSGQMEGRLWTQVDLLSGSFEKGDFVQVRGRAVSFQDRLQLNISHLEKVDEDQILLSDFFPSTEKDVEVMVASLKEIGDQVRSPSLRGLLRLFWEDRPFMDQFKRAPASTHLHHTSIGGLLEHTLSLTELVLKTAHHYSGLNLDLLITASILHDIGKVDELTYRRSFGYSDEGRLLGHIVLGLERVEEKLRLIPDFPKEMALQLKHLLISHHGEYEWGSPRKPMTLEAILLHYLDHIDAKINGVKQFLKGDHPQAVGVSRYHPLFEQHFYSPPGPYETEPLKIIEEIPEPND